MITPPPGPRGLIPAGRARGVFLAVLGALATGAAGCATKHDLAELRTTVRDGLQRQEEQLANVAVQLQALQDSVELQSDVVLDTRGGLVRELRDLSDQVARLTELTGQIQRTLAAVRDRMDNPDASGGRPGRNVPGDEPGTNAAAVQAWNAAQNAYTRGQLTTARFGFESFVQRYPEHPQAPTALFYLADILEQEGRLEEAVQGFLRVQELFPTSDQVPRALYRVGALYVLLGDQEQARQYLERVIATYPASGEATLAREKLREIGG